MTFFNVKNLLFCNNDFICYQILVYHAVKRLINLAYKIHVRFHTYFIYFIKYNTCVLICIDFPRRIRCQQSKRLACSANTIRMIVNCRFIRYTIVMK